MSMEMVNAKNRLTRAGIRAGACCVSGFILTAAVAHAQTPMAVRNLSRDTEPKAAAIAANNPWFGAQIAHRFGTDGEFESNLLTAAQFVYDIPFKVSGSDGGDTADATGDAAAVNAAGKGLQAPATRSFLTRFHLPVVSNFGGKLGPGSGKDAIDAQVKELLGTASGVTAGLFPYYEMRKSDNVLLTLHGLFAWRYNSLTATAESSTADAADTPESGVVALHQVKTGAGLEAVIGDRSDGKGGLTISVTPVFTRFADKEAYKRAFGEDRSSLGAVEFVGIVPISAKGVGIVIEGVAAQGGKRSFRAGLIFVGQPE